MGATERRRRGSRRRIKAIAAGVGAFAGTAARADGNSLDFKFLHYSESGGRTQVSNPEIHLLHDFGQKGQIGVLLSYDAISGASPTGAGPTIDATTSASSIGAGSIPLASYTDTRQAISLSYSNRFGSHLPSATLSYSHESDYLSRGISLVDTWDLTGGRTTLHGGLGATSDQIDPGNSNDHFTKSSFALSAGWTRVLGARDLLDISVGLDNLSGYLTDPYKVVPIGTTNVPEVRPDARSRKTAILKYGHYFLGRSALKTFYRYYWDDWSIQAHTLEVSWDKRLGRKVILTPRLRYYRQGSADFFAYEFQSPQQYMSSDYRLSSFWSWLGGLGLTIEVNDRFSLNLAGNYTDQTGLDRMTPQAPAPPPEPLRWRGLLSGSGTRVLGEDGEGGDDEGGGGASSISPADMKVLSFTAGFAIKF